MNSRALLGRFAAFYPARRRVERQNRFHPLLEALEDRKLLSTTYWTLDSTQSFITLSIPDQATTIDGISTTVQFRNQTGSTNDPWSTNTARITGQLATEYTDDSSIQFLGGQSNLSALTSGSYRPNFASFDDMAAPPTFTDTSTAPGDIGARIRATIPLLGAQTIAFLSISDLTYDIASAALTIGGGDFDANTTTFATTGGTIGVDGVSVLLVGQLIPDTLGSLTTPITGTNAAPIGSVSSLGGLQRQLTLPLDFPFSFQPDPNTPPLTGTVTGQLVATATISVASNSTVAGRHIFYNQSAYDGASAAAGLPIDFASDELARAPDKTAYLPGDPTAVAFNIINYSRGITGLMIDLSTSGGIHQSISASDFVFKTGANNTPSSWAAAPAPTSVAVSLGGGIGGTDRVEITWSSTISVKNAWLEVQMLATANTGLLATDVFFWGNKIADSASGALNATNFITNTTDSAQVFATLVAVPGATITNLRDYNRDKGVTTTDSAIVFASLGNLNRLNVGSAGPFAPEGGGGGAGDGDAGISSALAGASAPASASSLALPTAIVERLDSGGGGGTSAAVDAALASSLDDDADDDDGASDLDELMDSLAAGL